MSREHIGELVVRMQESFLLTPGLTLSLHDAEQRFGFEEPNCEAILEVLVDAGVLMKLRTGTYTRLLPHSSASRIRPVFSGPVAA